MASHTTIGAAPVSRAGAMTGRRRSPWATLALVGKYAYLCLFSLFFLFPIYWIVTNAFKLPGDILTYPPVWVPTTWTLENFDVAVTRYNGLGALTNSLIVAAGSTALRPASRIMNMNGVDCQTLTHRMAIIDSVESVSQGRKVGSPRMSEMR